jgi:hypothetical protein
VGAFVMTGEESVLTIQSNRPQGLRMIKERVGPKGDPYYTVSDDITLWIGEGGSAIHIKTIEPHGDPVELNEHEAIELIELLNKLVAEMQRSG